MNAAQPRPKTWKDRFVIALVALVSMAAGFAICALALWIGGNWS